jgi:hypothetical protein
MPNPNTAVFPASIPTDVSLAGVATDNLYTTLSASINNSQTNNIAVTSSSFEVPALLLIDSELILVESKAGNILNDVTRGFAGTTAASHLAGANVYGYIFAFKMNQISAEIKAICNSLGQNLSNILYSGRSAGGDLAGTYPNPTLANIVGLTPGTFGEGEYVPVITVDQKGRITEISETPITITGGGNPTGPASGDLGGTYPSPTVETVGSKTKTEISNTVNKVANSTNANVVSTLVERDSNGDFAARNITATQFIGSLTGNVNGNVTGNVSGTAASFTGNLTGDVTSVGMTTTLSNTPVTPAEYGSSTQVAKITIDSKGRITAAVNETISGVIPGGAAGGDLAGTYPNPTVSKSSFTSFSINDVRIKDNSGNIQFRNFNDDAFIDIEAKRIFQKEFSNVPATLKYSIPYTDLVDADVTQEIIFASLPAKAKVLAITLKTETEFSGSGFTSVNVEIGDGNIDDYYVTVYDCDATVSNTNYSDTQMYKSPTFSPSNLVAKFTANQNFGNGTTTNLSSGNLDIWVTVVVLL